MNLDQEFTFTLWRVKAELHYFKIISRMITYLSKICWLWEREPSGSTFGLVIRSGRMDMVDETVLKDAAEEKELFHVLWIALAGCESVEKDKAILGSEGMVPLVISPLLTISKWN